MKAKQNNWTLPMPVYVTRKNTDGETGTFSLSIWLVVLAGFLLALNVIGWGIVGLVEIVRYFV